MRSNVIGALLGLSLVATLLPATAQAQPADKLTYFTFSGPIALPGATLPAGRYAFRIVDTETTRKVIQVLSDDQKKPYAMMNTIPDTRRDPVKDATVSFYETPAGTPAAVKSWWYPGESIGYQFIYPRAQARQIAQATHKPVLTTKSASTKNDETKSGSLARVDENGRDTDVDAAGQQAAASNNKSTAPVATSGAATATANNNNNGSGFRDESANSTVFNRNAPSINEGANRTQSAQNNAQNTNAAARGQVARNELPKTASNLPFVGLIGMISALGFVTLRYGMSSFRF
jgi:hypothetical protein